MRIKKVTTFNKFIIISSICIAVMLLGVILLSNHSVSEAMSNWVIDGAGEGNYTAEQRELYTDLMIILILGMPVFAVLIRIISALRRSMLKRKLIREGRHDEYRELFGKCDN